MDKIEEPEPVRRLLRDIKGIFEIPGVFFIVSVSEEVVTATRLGPLQGRGLNEFSSFYDTIEVPPLSPQEIHVLMRSKGIALNDQHAGILCMLSGGNCREALRLLKNTSSLPTQDPADPLDWEVTFATGTLAAEAAALRREIIRAYGKDAGASKVLRDVWRALPDAAFDSPDAFEVLGKTAIHDFWDLAQSDAKWRDIIGEPWRRMLIRLFVTARAIAVARASQATRWDNEYASDLRDVLIMADRSTEVARLMLAARFGDDLAGSYTRRP